MGAVCLLLALTASYCLPNGSRRVDAFIVFHWLAIIPAAFRPLPPWLMAYPVSSPASFLGFTSCPVLLSAYSHSPAAAPPSGSRVGALSAFGYIFHLHACVALCYGGYGCFLSGRRSAFCRPYFRCPGWMPGFFFLPFLPIPTHTPSY